MSYYAALEKQLEDNANKEKKQKKCDHITGAFYSTGYAGLESLSSVIKDGCPDEGLFRFCPRCGAEIKYPDNINVDEYLYDCIK